MNMWQFFHEHWFIAWCALWLFWPVAWLADNVLVRLPIRILRTINIVFRGWPPEHLDADGDWQKHQTKGD